MPVIPNFNSWGPQANLGANYIAGARTGASMEQARAEIGLGQQRLAQQATLANMEFDAKRQQLEQATLHDQQKLEVEKQYRISQLGLEQQRIDQSKQRMEMQAQEAARAFEVNNRYRSRFAELGSTDDAARQAALEVGPELGGGSFSAALRDSGQNPDDNVGIGEVDEVPGVPGMKRFKRGPRSYSLMADAPDTATPARPIEGAPGKVLFAGKVLNVAESPEISDARSELKALVAADSKDSIGARYEAQESEGEKLRASAKQVLESYRKRKKRIAELRQEISAAREDSSSGADIPAGLQPKRKYTIVRE
jgi:hypothetical protein